MIWLMPALAGTAIPSCGLFIKEPEVSVKDVALASISLSSFTLNVMVSVNNKNPIGVTIKTLTFSVFYQDGSEWTYLTCGLRKDFPVNAGPNELVMPVTIENMKMMGALVSVIAKGEITLRIKGEATLSFLGFSPRIPFTHVTTVPLQLPKS